MEDWRELGRVALPTFFASVIGARAGLDTTREFIK